MLSRGGRPPRARETGPKSRTVQQYMIQTSLLSGLVRRPPARPSPARRRAAARRARRPAGVAAAAAARPPQRRLRPPGAEEIVDRGSGREGDEPLCGEAADDYLPRGPG